MPEVSENAALLIATSLQSLQRYKKAEFGEKICASAVIVVFACIYLEQSLDKIIKELKVKRKMERAVKKATNHRQPSLLEKYIWFCNEYIIDNNEKVKEPFRICCGEYVFKTKLDELVPDFNLLRYLRNKITHGKIDYILPYLDNIEDLRQSAKEIVYKLLDRTNLKSIRKIYWEDAVKRLENQMN